MRDTTFTHAGGGNRPGHSRDARRHHQQQRLAEHRRATPRLPVARFAAHHENAEKKEHYLYLSSVPAWIHLHMPPSTRYTCHTFFNRLPYHHLPLHTAIHVLGAYYRWICTLQALRCSALLRYASCHELYMNKSSHSPAHYSASSLLNLSSLMGGLCSACLASLLYSLSLSPCHHMPVGMYYRLLASKYVWLVLVVPAAARII